jgi:hypothetical protein
VNDDTAASAAPPGVVAAAACATTGAGAAGLPSIARANSASLAPVFGGVWPATAWSKNCSSAGPWSAGAGGVAGGVAGGAVAAVATASPGAGLVCGDDLQAVLVGLGVLDPGGDGGPAGAGHVVAGLLE